MLTTIAVTLFFAANLCFCAAYVVRDIFWLRVLTVIAALMTFPYFIFQNEVLYSALLWQSAFAIINIVNIVQLLVERRPLRLTEEQAHLKNMVFRNFTAREMVKLLDTATWHDGRNDEKVIRQGESNPVLHLLYSGSVEISKGDQWLAHRGPGCFLGELHFLTGDPNMADVKFTSPSRYLSWDSATLARVIDRHSNLKVAFESLLAVHVANKLASRDTTPRPRAVSFQ